MRYLLAAIALLLTGKIGIAPSFAAETGEMSRLFDVPLRNVGMTRYPQPILRLSPTSLRRFDDALPEIARQTHLTFVCEGQPFHPELTEEQVKELSAQFGTSGLPLSVAVVAVAAAYDYNAVRTGPHVYLLNKRYSNPEDLPDIPYEESAASLHNILKAVHDYVPPVAGLVRLRSIYDSFSQEDRDRLARGIPVASLSEDQRQTIWQVACQMNFRYLHDIKWLSRRIDVCNSPEGAFVKAETVSYLVGSHLNCPAFVGPFGVVDKKPREFILSGHIYIQSGGGAAFDGAFNFIDKKAILSDPNIPDPLAPRKTIPVAPVSKLRLSLREAADRLSRRYSSSRPDQPAVTVNPTLASKAICIAGAEYSPPDDLVQAVADVYGLSVRKLQGVDTLVQPLPRRVDDPSEVNAEMRRLLPLPFLEKVDSSQDPPKIVTKVPPGGEKVPVLSHNAQLSRARLLYNIAVRRAREVVEPEMEKRPDYRLPVMEAGEEARRMVALASLASLADSFGDTIDRVYPQLLHFDVATVQLTPIKYQPNTFHFYMYDPLSPKRHTGGFDPDADPNIPGAPSGFSITIPPGGTILPE